MQRAYKEYTKELDRLTTSSVTWELYAGEAAQPFLVSNLCSSNSELYRMRCPLICFYAVEFHLPHRVARQFGVRQLYPPELVSTGFDLHKLDRQKNKKMFNWTSTTTTTFTSRTCSMPTWTSTTSRT